MIRKLNPFLLKFTRPFYLAPDLGGDGGGGESDTGAAAAVADPPADGGDDVASFVPPGIDEAVSAITGKGSPAPKVEEPVKTAPKVDPKAQPKVDPKKATGEPPAAHLRKELDTVKSEREAIRSELAQLKQQLEAGDPRLSEAQNTLKAKDQEIEQARKQLSDYETKLKLGNPALREKLTTMDTAYSTEAERFFRSVTEIDQPTLNSLVREYAQLPFGKPEYREARQQFESTLQERLGSDRKLDKVLGFVERTYDFIGDRQNAEQELQRDAHKLAFDAEVKEYTGKKTHVSKLIEDAKGLPARMAKENPAHPGSFIHAFMSTLDEEKSAQVDEGIDSFVEKVLAGTAPKSDADYAGMRPQDIAAAKAAEQENVSKVRDHAAVVMVNGLRALRLFPSLVKEMQRLKEKVGEEGDAIPPDPGATETSASAEAGDDLKNFQAPDLNALRF